ncbi:glucosamine-6-phosphate deaminase [Devosia submarina]|uniref:glucosamine-6-phosphate deaminase n=1 Tax=Devosia submarina TaxID=1173082 RepID=UPI000D3A1F3D|nr:glucosamine-6-phosphate deaminase [Devosia submarina]
MDVIVKASAEAVADFVHEQLLEHIKLSPASVLGLPTGGTPEPIYARLVESYRSGLVSWKDITTFNLDEYIGLGADHPGSYATYMRERLFDHVDGPAEHHHIPNGLAGDPAGEAAEYEGKIAAAGGIDLMLLGLGQNGHIGFNEPGSSFQSRTRAVDLTPSTIAANQRFFGAGELPPRKAISMGIGTILEARRIIVVATGEVKAVAVRRMLGEQKTPDLPASALQDGRNVMVVLDALAASEYRGAPFVP